MSSVKDIWRHHSLDVLANKRYGHVGDTTDCVRYLYEALRRMYPQADVRSKHKALHLNGYPLGSFANLEAMVELGIAKWVSYAAPGSVVIGQTWGPVNHAFSSLEPERMSPDQAWILHATTAEDWYHPHNLQARLDDAATWKMVQLLHPYDVAT